MSRGSRRAGAPSSALTRHARPAGGAEAVEVGGPAPHRVLLAAKRVVNSAELQRREAGWQGKQASAVQTANRDADPCQSSRQCIQQCSQAAPTRRHVCLSCSLARAHSPSSPAPAGPVVTGQAGRGTVTSILRQELLSGHMLLAQPARLRVRLQLPNGLARQHAVGGAQLHKVAAGKQAGGCMGRQTGS